MVPPKWGGGRGGPSSREGFRYDESEQDEDPGTDSGCRRGYPIVTIRYGDVGQRMLQAFHASTAALTTAGNNVVIDEMLLAAEQLDDWLDALEGIEVFFVGVYCPLAVLEERERRRGHRAGLARGHLRTVHAHGCYDLEVDAGGETAPADLARVVLTRRAGGPAATAFATLRRRRRDDRATDGRAAGGGDPVTRRRPVTS